MEFLAVLPAVLVLAALVWQFALTGHAAWLTANAARVAARAEAVGEDPKAAARSALPNYLERHLLVKLTGGDGFGDDGSVTVRVRVPLLLKHWDLPLSIKASAYLQRQRR